METLVAFQTLFKMAGTYLDTLAENCTGQTSKPAFTLIQIKQAVLLYLCIFSAPTYDDEGKQNPTVFMKLSQEHAQCIADAINRLKFDNAEFEKTQAIRQRLDHSDWVIDVTTVGFVAPQIILDVILAQVPACLE